MILSILKWLQIAHQNLSTLISLREYFQPLLKFNFYLTMNFDSPKIEPVKLYSFLPCLNQHLHSVGKESLVRLGKIIISKLLAQILWMTWFTSLSHAYQKTSTLSKPRQS
jgi:hypothetical protein